MKKIYNPKLILYLLPAFVGIVLGCLFFVADSVINYVFGSILLMISFFLIILTMLFVPRNYVIDKDGIRIFYGIKKCNSISWRSIYSIDLRFDVYFDFFFFLKNYVVSHNNMISHIRLIDTVTKTKRTQTEIEKYWWKSIQ